MMQNPRTSRDGAPAPSLLVLTNNKKASKPQSLHQDLAPGSPRVLQPRAHGNWGHRGQCVTDGDVGASFPGATGVFEGGIGFCKGKPAPGPCLGGVSAATSPVGKA